MATTRRDSKLGRSYDTEDGTFPSVTTILKVLNKPALVNWAAKVERELVLEKSWELYEDVSPAAPKMKRIAYIETLSRRIGAEKAHEKALAKAGDIGSQVHALIEWNLRREMGQECGEQPRLEPEAVPAFASYEAWRGQVRLVPKHLEQTVWNKYDRYAGTLDVFGTVDDVAAVIDFKTSRAVYDEYPLQIAAYVQALIAMGHLTTWVDGWVVRLPKSEGDGFEAVKIPAADMPGHYREFLHCVALHQWQERNRLAWEAKKGVAA